jgi:hypothetical protein
MTRQRHNDGFVKMNVRKMTMVVCHFEHNEKSVESKTVGKKLRIVFCKQAIELKIQPA